MQSAEKNHFPTFATDGDCPSVQGHAPPAIDHAERQRDAQAELNRLNAIIREQKALQDELFRRAYYDELTGLPMRRVIERHVNDLLHAGCAAPFALAFLDID